MNLESLVPARETCERLRDAGFPAKTAAAWWTYDGGDPYVMTDDQVADLRGHVEGTFRFVCAAPTLQEVLDALPPNIIRPPVNEPGGGEWFLTTSALYGSTLVRVCYDSRLGGTMPLGVPHGMASREAGSYVEAAARLWLALASASLLPPPEAAQTAEGQR